MITLEYSGEIHRFSRTVAQNFMRAVNGLAKILNLTDVFFLFFFKKKLISSMEQNVVTSSATHQFLKFVVLLKYNLSLFQE